MNIVSVFFYYMWNKWTKEECYEIWAGCEGDHFWGKWEYAWNRNKSPWGATEIFYAELSENNRQKLVDRALELYKLNGNKS